MAPPPSLPCSSVLMVPRFTFPNLVLGTFLKTTPGNGKPVKKVATASARASEHWNWCPPHPRSRVPPLDRSRVSRFRSCSRHFSQNNAREREASEESCNCERESIGASELVGPPPSLPRSSVRPLPRFTFPIWFPALFSNNAREPEASAETCNCERESIGASELVAHPPSLPRSSARPLPRFTFPIWFSAFSATHEEVNRERPRQKKNSPTPIMRRLPPTVLVK